jgi:hypothetical protein
MGTRFLEGLLAVGDVHEVELGCGEPLEDVGSVDEEQGHPITGWTVKWPWRGPWLRDCSR